MSNNINRSDPWLFALQFTVIYWLIYEATKPSNENRPHWFAFYFNSVMNALVVNVLLLLWLEFHLEDPWLYIGNAVYCCGFLVLLYCNVIRDLPLVAYDRYKRMELSYRQGALYVDPYKPFWFRRVGIVTAVIGVELVAYDFNFEWRYCIATFSIAFVLYAIRDIIYADYTEVIADFLPEAKVSKKALFLKTLDICIQDLQKRGIPDEYLCPPIYLLAWSWGFRWKPAIYSEGYKTAFATGCFWFFTFGGGFSLLQSGRIDVDLLLAVTFCSSIAVFGITLYLLHSQQKDNEIPEWDIYERKAIHEIGGI